MIKTKNTNDIDSLTNEVNELWEELNKLKIDSSSKEIVLLMEALKVGDNFVMNSIYFHPG